MAERLRQRLAQAPLYLLLALAVVVMGVPFYWVVTGALKTNKEIYTFPPVWIPREPHWENFVEAWDAAPFGRFYLNSIVTTLVGSGLELLLALTSAYALVFLRVRVAGAAFLLILAALLVPSQVTLLPNYLTVARLGWINTYQGSIVPGASVAFGTFLFRQHFRALSREILDAAVIDGCGHLRLLWQVVVPLSQPVIVTFILISMVSKWNEFLWPLVVTNSLDMRTLPIGIAYLYSVEGVMNWGPILAGTLFVILPMLVIYLLAQRWIVSGIASGAVKG